MANAEFSDTFIGANAIFQPYHISDHTPAVLRIPMITTSKRKPFKFTNLLVYHENFGSIVEACWGVYIKGVPMYRLVKRLKSLKKPFRKLLFEKGGYLDEESFLKQKAKINWLNVGDSNSAYFHKVVKSRATRGRIDSILDANGTRVDGNDVPQVFLDHFSNFLGKPGSVQPLDLDGLFSNRLTVEQGHDMIREVSDEEIKISIFSMGDDKAPGPDGFTVVYFKKAWNIIGDDVIKAVKNFFSAGTLLKEVNHTIISLLPKVSTPARVNDLRPISLCNVVFKCITKIIANCIKDKLTDLVSINQSAFVPGRRLTDNILLTQKLMHNYHLDRGLPVLLLKLTFKRRMTRVVWESLEEFKSVSGLAPSLPKSTAYFCNVLNHVKLSILNILPFEEGRLPVKYLGVLLVSSRLVYRDCKELLERVHNRISNWKTKFLSFTGRLQLVQSVLSSMHIYWSSVFILPTRVTSEIEQMMRGFLWSQCTLGKGKAKVSWDVVCLPKQEGGLGIRRLETSNVVLMATHIWNLLTVKESLWVKWVHTYRLRGRSFWDIPLRGNMPWSWKKLLAIRPLVRNHFWHSLGNGQNTFAWHDTWATCCPIIDIVTHRMIKEAGFESHSKVVEIIENGTWRLPSFWDNRILNTNVPLLQEHMMDSIKWRTDAGVLHDFSVSLAWEDLRVRAPLVDWYHIVWYKQCIPKYSFLLWLVMKRKLKTQDLLNQWDVQHASLAVTCPLCSTQPDSHTHLFFDCLFSSRVWDEVNKIACLSLYGGSWADVLHDLKKIARKNSVHSVVSKLILAGAVYNIW
uniref:uncharacterized protein LOC122601300 n=1 Tax=Erigeron canadensis TaxID=72917 RepID=UPI001CB942D9|nr:uncharacterized protein LOC122601300 [Erigeron canadensis]